VKVLSELVESSDQLAGSKMIRAPGSATSSALRPTCHTSCGIEPSFRLRKNQPP